MSLGRMITLAVLGAALLAGPAGAQQDLSLPDLENEVMCPTCGTTLALSESPQADQIREFIRVRIEAGLGEEEIKDELVAEYGDEVLAVPDTSGFDLVAWVAPVAGLLIAAVALLVGVRRWRARGEAGPGAGGPGAGSGPAVSAADEERLRADLGRYEL
jgi:cytochrome c-type biogenesis protein CcmH